MCSEQSPVQKCQLLGSCLLPLPARDFFWHSSLLNGKRRITYLRVGLALSHGCFANKWPKKVNNLSKSTIFHCFFPFASGGTYFESQALEGSAQGLYPIRPGAELVVGGQRWQWRPVGRLRAQPVTQSLSHEAGLATSKWPLQFFLCLLNLGKFQHRCTHI